MGDIKLDVSIEGSVNFVSDVRIDNVVRFRDVIEYKSDFDIGVEVECGVDSRTIRNVCSFGIGG